MDAALYVLLSVTHAVYRPTCIYRSSYMMCGDTFEINPPLLLKYYEAKIQMLLVLSWKPAVRQNSNFLIFKSVLIELKATDELWPKIDNSFS